MANKEYDYKLTSRRFPRREPEFVTSDEMRKINNNGLGHLYHIEKIDRKKVAEPKEVKEAKKEAKLNDSKNGDNS